MASPAVDRSIPTLLLSVAVSLATAATLMVNYLANGLPINGQTTGDVTRRFEVYFVPAGYVFSIWGVIYAGLIAYSVYLSLALARGHRDSGAARAIANQAGIEDVRARVTPQGKLDTIRDLKQINSLLATLAYPVLEEQGLLASSRLRLPEVSIA